MRKIPIILRIKWFINRILHRYYWWVKNRANHQTMIRQRRQCWSRLKIENRRTKIYFGYPLTKYQKTTK